MFSSKRNKILLKDIVYIEKGEMITRENVIEGNVPVVAAGIEPSCYHNKSNRNKNIITISASGANAGYVNYWNIPIFASDCNTVLTKDDNILNEIFLFYTLFSMQEKIFKLQKGAGQPHVYAKDLEKIIITLPPIDLQNQFADHAQACDKLKFTQ